MVTPILPLKLDAVEVTRRGKRLLGPISLTLQGDGLTILMGPNGSGKTTLLRSMHGLERISAGRVTWQCDAVAARPHQSFVFQTPTMMRRSVLDSIAYPLRLIGRGKAEARKTAAGWAERVGLSAVMERPAHVLSGGEKQKLALARALIRDPQILFLDEPCANLDGHAIREIEAILHDIRAAGTRIVMSTHDIGQARRLADDVLFLYRGQKHETAPRDNFFNAPETDEVRAFLKGDLVV